MAFDPGTDDPLAQDHVRQAFADWRTERDKRELRDPPRVVPIRAEPVGMDDRPFAPATPPRVIIPKPERASRFLSAASLAGQPVPDRQWLARDMIPARNVTLLSGDGGTGKSLLSLQLACAVALGGQWLGRAVAGGHAVYMSAEDELDELHRRLADIVAAEGVTLADLDRLTIRSLAGEDALLARADGPNAPLAPSALFEELDAFLADLRPALLVLDTLADLFPGNENDRAQARQFVGMLRGLALRHDCAIVLLSHPSRSGLSTGSGDSGSTAWNNSVRSRLYFERIAQDGIEVNPDARILRTMKANYGRTGAEIPLTWRDGVFIADATETGLDRMAGNAKAERVFLKLLQLFEEQGRYVSASPSNAFAPTIFAAHPQAESVTKEALRQAMEALFDRGQIIVAEHGKGAKARSHIAIARGNSHA